MNGFEKPGRIINKKLDGLSKKGGLCEANRKPLLLETASCVLRYQVWRQPQETEPDITVESVATMPKADVMCLAEFEKLENPCGE